MNPTTLPSDLQPIADKPIGKVTAAAAATVVNRVLRRTRRDTQPDVALFNSSI